MYRFAGGLQLGILGGVSAVAAYLLTQAYALSRAVQLRRSLVAAGKRGDARTPEEASLSATLFALFQVNFWFYFLVALSAFVILPQFSARDFPGSRAQFGLASYSATVGIPALVVFASGRTRYF